MWKSFGFLTEEVDGHNVEQLRNAYTKNLIKDKPKAILANTIKGKGISFAENDNNWHHAVLSKSIYEKAMAELNK